MVATALRHDNSQLTGVCTYRQGKLTGTFGGEKCSLVGIAQ